MQLVLFARMRWIFRSVVYICTATLLLTGSISVYRNWDVLSGEFIRFLAINTSEQEMFHLVGASVFNWPRFWLIAHLISGLLSLVFSVVLVSGGKPPSRPVQWLRLNLFVMLIAIFLASALRSARQNLFQSVLTRGPSPLPGNELQSPLLMSEKTAADSVPGPNRLELAPGVHVPTAALRFPFAQRGPWRAECEQAQHQGRAVDSTARPARPQPPGAEPPAHAGRPAVTINDELHISSESERSQERNRQEALDHCDRFAQ